MKKYGKFVIVLITIGLIFLFSYAIYDTLAPTYEASSEDTTQEENSNDSAEKETSAESTAEETSKDDKIAAYDFEVLDWDGNEISLSDYFGKPIIVNFWATWCGPCASELQAFDDLYKKYGSEIQFMMLNQTDGTQDTVNTVKSFVEEKGYSFPVFFDTKASATWAYGVYSIPVTLVIDADGNIVSRYTGAMDAENIESHILDVIDPQGE